MRHEVAPRLDRNSISTGNKILQPIGADTRQNIDISAAISAVWDVCGIYRPMSGLHVCVPSPHKCTLDNGLAHQDNTKVHKNSALAVN